MQYKWMFKLQFLLPYYNDEYVRNIIIARNLVQMTLSRIPVESEVNYQCNEKTETPLDMTSEDPGSHCHQSG